jgi:hypothetical protein
MKRPEKSKDDEETSISLTGFRAENRGVKSESKKRCDNKVFGATRHPEATGAWRRSDEFKRETWLKAAESWVMPPAQYDHSRQHNQYNSPPQNRNRFISYWSQVFLLKKDVIGII